MSTTDVNLLDPAVLECPYDAYARLRASAPVSFSQLGFWLISRYEDVLAVVRDPHRFSSNQAFGPAAAASPSPERQAILDEGYPHADTLITNDPPSHTHFRGLVNKSFTPKRVAQLESSIRQISNELVDAFIADGKVEFVSQFAVGLPMTVIADALGVTRADMDRFKRWSDDSVAVQSQLLTEEQLLQCARSHVEFQKYMVDRIEERRSQRRNDLLSDLVHAAFDGGERAGEHLTIAEMLDVIAGLLVAGNETTRHLIASGMLLLLEYPDQMVKLRSDPSLIPNFVEEVLRYEPPVQMLFRTAREDVEVGGVTIPRGSLCAVMYASANRDEAIYEDGSQFDVTRANARTHLSFGQGPHFCIGAALARSEARIAFETLLGRLDNIELASISKPIHRELSLVARGPSALHLMFGSKDSV